MKKKMDFFQCGLVYFNDPTVKCSHHMVEFDFRQDIHYSDLKVTYTFLVLETNMQ